MRLLDAFLCPLTIPFFILHIEKHPEECVAVSIYFIIEYFIHIWFLSHSDTYTYILILVFRVKDNLLAI